MKKRLFRLVKPSDPLLVTRWFDVASGATWFLYVAYAAATLLSPLLTFKMAGAPPWYPVIWSIGAGGSALLAALGAHWIFYDGKAGLLVKKRLERDSLWALIAFMCIYELLLIDVVVHGALERLAQIFLFAALLPLPFFRIAHLNHRIRGMRIQPKVGQ